MVSKQCRSSFILCLISILLLFASGSLRRSRYRSFLDEVTRKIQTDAFDQECAPRLFNVAWRVSPDAHLRTPELITKYGYPVEKHHVTTEDGYILTLYRIPWGKRNGSKRRRGKPAILIQHGTIQSSSDFLMNPESKCLPYILANAGYDVWLGNSRGTSYSDKHVSMTIDDLEYWKFSWHEMGVFDIPATIDHILGVTKEKQLYYIGHSMGSTLFWVAMSMRPEYNVKIKLMVAMAPVAYMKHLGTLKAVAPFATHMEKLFDLAFNGKFMWNWQVNLIHAKGPLICAPSPVALTVCGALGFYILGSGFDLCQFNTTEQISNIAGHIPDISSSRTIIHYLQLKMSRKFARYDYGATENRAIYGCSSPPSYDLSAVTAPVALIWGQNDRVATPKDVAHLARHLPNVVSNERVKFHLWTHWDFTYGIDVDSLVYKDVVQLLCEDVKLNRRFS